MTLYERLKDIQKLIGHRVSVEDNAGQWLLGRIHEIYIGKEVKVTVSVDSVSPLIQLIQVGATPDVVSTIQSRVYIELVGIDEIRRRLIG